MPPPPTTAAPTLTPSSADIGSIAEPPDCSARTAAVRSPAEAEWNPTALLCILAPAAALVLLIGFAVGIFNKTFKENKDATPRWFR